MVGWAYTQATGGGGGTGIRDGFKIHCPQGHVGSIPTRRTEPEMKLEEGKREARRKSSGPVTGVGGSDAERRAARRLAGKLEALGREARIDPVSVRFGEGGDLILHCVLAVGCGVLGLVVPLAGAASCLAVAFSFYSARALGFPLLGRLMPKRSTQNVLSPRPGPEWVRVEVILAAGYDSAPRRPFETWLANRFSGRLTVCRLAFWGGMVPLFVVLMLRVAGIEGELPGVLQLIFSAVLLGLVASELDAMAADDPTAGPEDLVQVERLMETLEELSADPDAPGVGVALFGAERRSAAGAGSFLPELAVGKDGRPALVNFLEGGRSGSDRPSSDPLVTAREGDLAVLTMNDEIFGPNDSGTERSILRRLTSAGVARRRGMIASSVIGGGRSSVDLALDAIYRAVRKSGSPDE